MKSSSTWCVVGLCGLAACKGDGSDVGPSFAPLPQAYGKVQVFDDAGRGVVGAVVTVPELNVQGTTGRNGRADLYTSLPAAVRVRVDGRYAAAVDVDDLGALEVVAPANRDLSVALYLPGYAATARATVTGGVQTTEIVIQEPSGATLRIASGGSVAFAGAATGEIKLGTLAAEHLPGPLPSAAGAWLFSSGYSIVPSDVAFTQATLDALQLTGSEVLFRFDEVSGTWQQAIAIAQGGLYCKATDVPATTATGHVAAAAGQLVNVDGRWAVTDSSGDFSIAAIPAELGNGAARNANIEIVAGGGYVPRRVADSRPLTLGTSALGEFAFATAPSANVRMQYVRRGRAEGNRHASLSSSVSPVAMAASADASGRVLFEDVPSGWMGSQAGHPRHQEEAFFLQLAFRANGGSRTVDAYAPFAQTPWWEGGRRSRTFVTDNLGGGPLAGAIVVAGATADSGYQDTARDYGGLYLDRGFSGRATAAHSSTADGRTVVSAVSIVNPDGEHIELPLERARWAPLAAFARHGLVAGNLLGADPMKSHQVHAHRVWERENWWNAVVEGDEDSVRAPRDVDVAVTHDTFVIGVPAPAGQVIGAEFDTSGATRTLARCGFAFEVIAAEGQRTALDLSLAHTADAPFVVAKALEGLDPALAAAPLSVDLALQRADGRVVDVARDLTGNHEVNGDDVTLRIPSLSGTLAGANWLAASSIFATVGDEVLAQRSVGTLAETGITLPLLAIPSVTAPLPNATVAAAGFTVEYSLPQDCSYARLDLVSADATSLHTWRVYLPPESTSFAFVTLPSQASTPLVANRTYKLTLTAYRADATPFPAVERPYSIISSFLQSMSPAELGVRAIASRAFDITTQ